MKNIIHFRADYDTIIHIDGQMAGICNKENCVDIIPQKDKMYVTFSTPNMLSQAMCFYDLCNTPCCDNEYIECIPYMNRHYDCYYHPIRYRDRCMEKILYSIIIGKLFISIIGKDKNCVSTLSIFDNNHPKFSYDIAPYDDMECGLFGKTLVCISKKDNKYHFMCIDTNYYTIKQNYICDHINVQKNIIRTLQYLDDLVGQGIVCNYDTTSNMECESYPIYRNKKAYDVTDNQLVPYALLMCIKADNIKPSLKITFISYGFYKIITYYYLHPPYTHLYRVGLLKTTQHKTRKTPYIPYENYLKYDLFRIFCSALKS